jgi:gliding motility-associated-like protein
MDTIKKTIRVGNFMIHFPNTFSPQGDLINDKFISKGIGIKDFEMTIYSRWGEPIHVTKDMNIGWDGTYQSTGVKCQQGVYVYDVIIRDVFGDIHRITGNVTLID